MHADLSDAALIGRVLAGDIEAYTRLVTRHYESCARYARRMLGNVQDAEDVLQETFLRSYVALRRYRERDRFRAWLFRILVNQCRSSARRRGRRIDRWSDGPHAEPVDAHPADDGGLGDALEAALRDLDPLMREALLLKYGEELEYEEMSRLTGTSVSALKMRVKRARDLVRPRLEGLLDE